MKEVNSNFPYLQPGIFPPESKNVVAAGEKIANVDITKKNYRSKNYSWKG